MHACARRVTDEHSTNIIGTSMSITCAFGSGRLVRLHALYLVARLVVGLERVGSGH